MNQKKVKAKRRLQNDIRQVLKNRTYAIVNASLKAEGKTFEELDISQKLLLSTKAKRQAEQDLSLALQLGLGGKEL